MIIDKQLWSAMLLATAEKLKAESSMLSDIDSRFGDGDHGVTIKKIALVLEQEANQWQDASLHDFIEGIGVKIMAVGGGSAGPLYGTLVGGLAEPLTSETEITPACLKAMLQASLDAMYEISTARRGDKTMMDALIPAVETAQTAPDSCEAILLAAAKAAEEGSKASEAFISKYGRAKSYKEKTIGTPDAGAVSTSLFFAGLAEGFLKGKV